MQVKNPDENPTKQPAAIATVGTFDGVHRGHRLVIDTMLERARMLDAMPLVFTFDHHPLCLIAPERAPGRLMKSEEEVETLRSLGVEVRVLHFDERLRSMKAAEWLSALRQKHNVKWLVMGFDNTFGSDGIDFSLADYMRIGEECGVDITVADRLPGVSSSIIRRQLREGKLREANEGLGRPFTLSGTVVTGKALGRRIGFPTANLRPDEGRLVPAKGVYAAYASLGNNILLPAIVNIGNRPTVSDAGDVSIEAHIIGWEGNIYGRELTLHFIERLRDEKHFGSLEELIGAIRMDRVAALSILTADSEEKQDCHYHPLINS
ncbi:MAG: riboflavin biosynthesis protein RibF [Bacteroidales bacterium]|nr:riboflavin biosynthesis protein RibF [Bacteroidales bacterium]